MVSVVRETVVDDDPADVGSVDDELPAIARAVKTEDDSELPHPDAMSDVLTAIGERAKQITADPVALLVSQVHEEIQQILRLQRDICDGVELAADQVQDKRIDFLEAGPEVTVADLFIEIALVFFLESPLVGLAVKKALRQAYRFARPSQTTIGGVSRAAKVTRLRAGAEKFRSPIVQPKDRAKLRELEGMELDARLELHRARTPEDQASAKKQLALIQDMKGELATIPDGGTAPKNAAPRPSIEGKDLRTYFIELDEMVVEYGVGGVKAAVAGVQKGAPTAVAKTAPDSISVALKSLSQAHLRNLEFDLGLAAADADMLRSVAQADPFLAPECLSLLTEMLEVLRRDVPPKGQQAEGVEPRISVMIEVEKLIWALITPNAASLSPERQREIRKDQRHLGELGSGAAAGSQVLQEDLSLPDPPRRVLEYWKARFFAGEKLNDDEIAKKMRDLRADFLKKSASEQLIAVTKVPFKKDG